jgi:putative peptide zinc metalloprotease protein
VAAFQQGRELPTRSDPVLAMVLVPTDDDAGTDGSSGEPAEPWVFPFDKPLPPAEGDNQALAVATTDGSVSYDVAFALVWAEGNEVLDVNEAHAYASCSDCVAVAVAFQVVLIMDDAQVVVPQNLAVAANYDCYRCITVAIANQLVLSVQREPGEAELRALGEVWSRLIEFARTITSYTPTQIAAQLETFEAEIVAILGEAPPVEPEPGLATPTSSAPTQDASDSPSPSPTAEASTTSPSPTAETTTTPPAATESPTPGSSSPTADTAPTSPSPTPDPTAPADISSPTPSPSP